MDEQTILTRYARYFEVFKKIAKVPICIPIRLEELEKKMGISRALIQSGYRDLKKDKKKYGFDGQLIDYYCWIVGNYVVMNWKKTNKTFESFLDIMNSDFVNSRCLFRLMKYSGKHFMFHTDFANIDFQKEGSITKTQFLLKIISLYSFLEVVEQMYITGQKNMQPKEIYKTAEDGKIVPLLKATIESCEFPDEFSN